MDRARRLAARADRSHPTRRPRAAATSLAALPSYRSRACGPVAAKTQRLQMPQVNSTNTRTLIGRTSLAMYKCTHCDF